jgi:hypothetical protein
MQALLTTMQTVYFAHPISDYNTAYETWVMDQLRRIYPQCHFENPNQPHHQQGYQDQGMDYFINLCASLNACVFDTFPGGIVGSGVAKEVESFLTTGRPAWKIQVIEADLFPLTLIPVSVIPPDIVASRDTTREMSKLYKVIGRKSPSFNSI